MSDPFIRPFPPTERATWSDAVGDARLTHRVSGIEVPALGEREASRRVSLPPRGGAWSLRPAIWCTEPDQANALMRDELSRGAEGFRVRMSSPTRRALDAGVERPDDRSPKLDIGVRIEDDADMARLLHGIADDVPIDIDGDIDAGTFFGRRVRAASTVAACRGTIGIDPLGSWVAAGSVPGPIAALAADLAEHARTALATTPNVFVARASAVPYHDAGATEMDEIACTLATAVTYVRWMIDGGLSPMDAISRVDVAMPLSSDLFAQAAKLRALRSVLGCAWAAYEVSFATPVHASTSWRAMTAVEPELNLLRTTTAAMAAALGGAASVTVLPHDLVADDANAAATGSTPRQLAGNVHAILAGEAHLGMFDDPLAGSHAIDGLTHDLANAAWERFRDIERAGGMVAVISGDDLTRDVRAAHDDRQAALAKRQPAIVGTSLYALPGTLDPVGGDDDRPSVAAFDGDRETCTPLPARRDGARFEALRRRTGPRPVVRLVTLGRSHKPRTEFARRLFQAGGLVVDVVASDAERSSLDPPTAIVYCGADGDLDAVAELVAAARAAGVRRCYVAAPPSDRWSEIDVVPVHRESDVIAVVDDLLSATAEGAS